MKPRFCGEAWERGDGVSATGLVVATWQEARIRPGSLVLAFWYLFIVIVSPGRNVGIQLTHSRTFSDGSQADILQKPYGGTRNPIPPEIVASGGHHRIHMEGKKVFRQAVYRMANAAHQVLQDTNTSPEDIDWVVPHQANQRILDAVAGELHLPTSKVFSHVRHYANTGSASVILALADMILKGLLQPNQRLVSVAFGDGFSWGSALWDVASLPPAEFLGRDM